MKGFLRKVMLIASLGATLTFFGCQKDYTNDINDVRNDLTAALEQQKTELEQAIEAARQEAQESAAAAEQAAKDYADGILTSAQAYADSVAKAIADSIKVEIMEDVQADIDSLIDRIEAVEGDIDDLTIDISGLDGRLKALEDLNIKNRLEELEGLNIDDRISALERFKTEFDQTFESIEALKERLESIESTNATQNEAIDSLKASVATILDSLKEIDSALAEIDSEIDSIVNDVDDLDARLKAIEDLKLNERLTKLESDFEQFKKDIAEQIGEAILGVEKKLGDRLTSISLIPELYLDGVPAFRFESIEYTPVVVDPETEAVSMPAGALTYWTAANVEEVRYHLSPAHVSVDGISSYDYLIETADVITKASEENNIIDIKGIEVNEDNELVVSVAKKSSTSTLSDESVNAMRENEYSVHTAALQLGIADELLYEGEENAFVTSEYSIVLENDNIAHITPLLDMSRDIEGYACEGDYIEGTRFATSYAGAKAAGAATVVDFDGELDLLTLVTACLHHGMDEGVELTKEEMAEVGLAFRFTIPTAENLVNGVDQQPFMTFKEGSETVVVSNIPEGTEEFDEALPIVRVELIDTNNDNAIVDVQWIKIRWINKVVPETDLGVVAEYNYYLGCLGARNTMNWQQINDSILVNLGKLDENDEPAGIDYEAFDKYYVQDDNSINVKLEAVGYELSPNGDGTYNDIVLREVDYSTDVEGIVLIWNVRISQIGEVIDQILAEGKVVKQIKITVAPRADMREYAGEFSFTLSLNVTVKDLPTIYGWNEVSSWTTIRELAEIDPVGFSDRSNTNPGVDEFVRYNFALLNLFNADDNGNFLNNIIPTLDQIAAYAEEGYDLEDHWSCRAWDIQFSATQPDGLNFAPAFATDPDAEYALNADGHYLRRAGQAESATWFDVAANPWYTDVQQFRVRLADKENKDYEGALALLNDINVAPEDRVEVSLNIWTRINQYNYYLIENGGAFNAWFVTPVTIPDPVVEGYFEDINMNPSTINIPIGKPEGIVDFQNSPVDSEAKEAYYGIEDIVWDTDNIYVDVIEQENAADGSVNLIVNPALKASNPADRARMSTAEECHFEINFDELTGALTVTNNTGQSLKQTCHLWVKATVGHAYGTRDIWYSIEYHPNAN